MNKPIKVALISVASVLCVLVIAVVVVCTFVFSKDRLTKAVKEAAADYVTCQTEIGSVELTFFSSFPDVALCLNDVAIINPMTGAQSDTLLGVHRLFAKIDAMAYLKEGSINVSGFTLKQAQANIYVNADSLTNYDVFNIGTSTEQEADTASGTLSLDKLALHNIDIVGLTATFLDMAHQMESRCRNVNLSLDTEANLQELTGGGDIDLEIGELFYSDSLNYAQLSDLKLKNSHLFYDGKDASVKMPKLSIGAQEYLLSGETALLAKIWGMELEDVDGTWKENCPTFEGVTRLDSSNVTLGKEDLMYISTGAVQMDMPVISTADLWTARVNTVVKALCFAMDSEGTLVDNMDIDTRFEASTNTQFNIFDIKEMETTAASQTISGEVHVDITDTTLLKADVDAKLKATTIGEILALVPASYKSALKGMNLEAELSDSHLQANVELGKQLVLKHVAVSSAMKQFQYSDDTNLSCHIDQVDATVKYPAGKRGKEFAIDGVMAALHVAMADDTTNIHVNIPGGSAKMLLRDDIIDGKDPRLSTQFDLRELEVSMDDTIKIDFLSPVGTADVDMASVKNCIKVATQASLGGMKMEMGSGLKGSMGQIIADFSCLYDDKQKDILDQVSPVTEFTLNDGKFQIEGIPYDVLLPQLNATFNKNQADLRSCQLNLGNSNMNIQGVVKNINDWLKKKALLEGNLKLKSPLVDVAQLMDLASGFGCETDSAATAPAAATENVPEVEADPFMVPKDVKFEVNTDIKTMQMNEKSFDNVRGQLTVDDGILVLEEMGFTSKAAKMQLTALYKSPERNNLFAAWNFHLLDIDIAEMISIVPEIDTIVPMISSFAGKAQFHLAGETALFADYNPKMSTLKAVAAIEGKDLTVLDNATFQTIKKYLFKESTTNKIDTLAVEMAVAKKKMTLYPMLIGWDKYEAVISGNHTVVNAMPFSYHISITKCPLVGGHLGLDITGNLDDIDNISYKLGSCKYANLYKPEKRNITQAQTLELKKLINTSLKRSVKPQESAPQAVPVEEKSEEGEKSEQ